jgi:hypothetical protein
MEDQRNTLLRLTEAALNRNNIRGWRNRGVLFWNWQRPVSKHKYYQRMEDQRNALLGQAEAALNGNKIRGWRIRVLLFWHWQRPL